MPLNLLALARLGVAVRTLCKRELRSEWMPMPPARSPPTKISSPSGKTPVLLTF